MELVSNTCQAAAPGTASGKPGRLGETDGSCSTAASGFSSEQQSDVTYQLNHPVRTEKILSIHPRNPFQLLLSSIQSFCQIAGS